MDIEKIMQSMKPVKEVVSESHIEEKIENETELQKLFDNRVGPSVKGSPTIDYHVFSPTKKDDDTRYPVVIWLHGMGQGYCFREPIRGTAISNYASDTYQSKFGNGAYIMIPRANEDLGMVDTTYRFMYTNSWLAGQEENGVSNQLPELVAAIRQFLCEEEKNIDFTRVYLVGFSAGGYMTWQILLAMPDMFAAVAPICQARFTPSQEQLNTVSNVPLWILCGEQDELYPSSVAPTVEKLKSHAADCRTTIFKTVFNPDYSEVDHPHLSWVPVTFDMFYNDGKPYDESYPEGFIAWLMSHKLDDTAGKSASHGHAMGKGIIDAGLIDSYAYESGDPTVGRMDYYLFDPVKHGADPNRDYPLLVVFHGKGNGGMNDILAGALADGMVYASAEYQKLLGGAYILFPKANEYDEPRVFEDGTISQPTGSWVTFDEMKPTEHSPYAELIYTLVNDLKEKNKISDVIISGTSMGGCMAWRYIINYTESVSAAIIQAPVYNPSDAELEKLEKAEIPIWVIVGIQDEVCKINTWTGPVAKKLYNMPNVRLSLLPWVRYGDGMIVRGAFPMEMGQHLALFAFGANMLYDNGLPYDVFYKDGIIAWLKNIIS